MSFRHTPPLDCAALALAASMTVLPLNVDDPLAEGGTRCSVYVSASYAGLYGRAIAHGVPCSPEGALLPEGLYAKLQEQALADLTERLIEARRLIAALAPQEAGC